MPKYSEKYQYYKMLCGFETFAYEKKGGTPFKDCTNKEGMTIAIPHYKKARAIYNLVSLTGHVNPMEATISLATKVIQSFANNGTVTLSSAFDLTSSMLPESKK